MTTSSAAANVGGLVDALDRVIETGAAVSGEVRLGLAGVDLIRLDLRALLASITDDGAVRSRRTPLPRPAQLPPPPPVLVEAAAGDDQTPDAGLGRLVIALVELVRQLMERQVMHRLDDGTLTDDEVERLGCALMALEDRMPRLCAAFGMSSRDPTAELDPLAAPPPPARRTA